jgi:uncharacterized membrane protein
MDTINWLHLRGLALLAFLGLFVMYALLAAYWHDWSAARRARRIAQQRKPLPAEPFGAGQFVGHIQKTA